MSDAFSLLRSTKRFMANVLGDQWEVRLDDEPGTYSPPYCRIERATPLSVSGPANIADNTLTLSIVCYPGEADSVELAQAAAHAIEESMWRAFRRGGGDLTGPRNAEGVAESLSGASLPAGSYAYTLTSCARRGESAVSATGACPVVIAGPLNAARITWTPVRSAQAYFIYRNGHLLDSVPVFQAHYVDDGTQAINPFKTIPTVSTARVGGPLTMPLYDYTDVPLDAPVLDDTGRDFYSFARVRDLSIRILGDPVETRQIATIATVRLTWSRTGDSLGGGDLEFARLKLHYK